MHPCMLTSETLSRQCRNIGSIDPKGMITKTIGLENVVEGGIKTIMKVRKPAPAPQSAILISGQEKDNHIKIMVDLKT